MIGSDDASDYAEVKNLVFSEANITHTLGGGDSIGTLAGDANGYVKVDNIAVASGSISGYGFFQREVRFDWTGRYCRAGTDNCEAVQLSICIMEQM